MGSLVNWILGAINNYPKCFNFGSYGYTTQEFNDRHVNNVSPIASRLLYWDGVSGTELHFLCVDKARFNSILSYAKTTYRLVIPDWMMFFLNSLSTFLDWFHF